LENLGPVISKHGLDKLGLSGVERVYWNLSTAQLVEMKATCPAMARSSP
jgi:hypothetical protein